MGTHEFPQQPCQASGSPPATAAPVRVRPLHSAVRLPPELPHDRWHEWLVEQPCACGQTHCPERRIGLLVPTHCATAEEWQARFRRYAAGHEVPPEFPEAELTMILNKGGRGAMRDASRCLVGLEIHRLRRLEEQMPLQRMSTDGQY
jgi:hypothetical protein